MDTDYFNPVDYRWIILFSDGDGLLNMFMRPGLSTPTSAGRTLGLPVLGTAGLKR